MTDNKALVERLQAGAELYAGEPDCEPLFTSELTIGDIRDAIEALTLPTPTREEVAAEAIAIIANSIPDEIDIYRIIRAAGRKDADKARMVRAKLARIEAAILQLIGKGG